MFGKIAAACIATSLFAAPIMMASATPAAAASIVRHHGQVTKKVVVVHKPIRHVRVVKPRRAAHVYVVHPRVKVIKRVHRAHRPAHIVIRERGWRG